MKIVYTGGEFLLSGYLNFLKVPMVLFFAILLVVTLMQCNVPDVEFKDTFLYRKRYWLMLVSSLCSLYMFVFWN